MRTALGSLDCVKVKDAKSRSFVAEINAFLCVVVETRRKGERVARNIAHLVLCLVQTMLKIVEFTDVSLEAWPQTLF